MFCIALPARVVVRMQTQEFECHIRPRTYLRAYFEKRSVSENETLHNHNTVQDLLYIKKLKNFDMVMAKVVMIRHGMSLFGPWAKQKEVHGYIVEVVGCGRGRKLKVKWDECDGVFILAPRALQLDDTASLEDSDEDTHSDTDAGSDTESEDNLGVPEPAEEVESDLLKRMEQIGRSSLMESLLTTSKVLRVCSSLSGTLKILMDTKIHMTIFV